MQLIVEMYVQLSALLASCSLPCSAALSRSSFSSCWNRKNKRGHSGPILNSEPTRGIKTGVVFLDGLILLFLNLCKRSRIFYLYIKTEDAYLRVFAHFELQNANYFINSTVLIFCWIFSVHLSPTIARNISWNSCIQRKTFQWERHC